MQHTLQCFHILQQQNSYYSMSFFRAFNQQATLLDEAQNYRCWQEIEIQQDAN